MKSTTIVASLCVFAASGFASTACNISVGASAGGRQIAIAIDSSGSMSWNDASDLRTAAGKALAGQLVSDGNNPDTLAVIEFSSDASLLYGLGDPDGSLSSFDAIGSYGGTNIFSFPQLSAPISSNHTGIVVITDGVDDSESRLLSSIAKAEALGIRVSFGFLAPKPIKKKRALEAAILATGSTFMSFSAAATMQSWLVLLVKNGLTSADSLGIGKSHALLHGVAVSHSAAELPVSFTYAGQQGETVVFEAAPLQAMQLDLQVTDATDAVLGTGSTEEGKDGTVKVTLESEGELVFHVVAAAAVEADEGIFQISVNSSLGLSNCNLADVSTTKSATSTLVASISTIATTSRVPVITASTTAPAFNTSVYISPTGVASPAETPAVISVSLSPTVGVTATAQGIPAGYNSTTPLLATSSGISSAPLVPLAPSLGSSILSASLAIETPASHSIMTLSTVTSLSSASRDYTPAFGVSYSSGYKTGYGSVPKEPASTGGSIPASTKGYIPVSTKSSIPAHATPQVVTAGASKNFMTGVALAVVAVASMFL